jgi:enoyl-CoA hydratase/carnithine racemase
MLEVIDHGPVRELQLARPPVNALDPGLVDALQAALDAAPASGAKVLVLSGRIGMFTAGLDVPALLALDRKQMAEFWKRFFGLTRTLAECPLPLAAAITGHSPAGGTVLSLFCDLRIAAEGDYKLGLNEVQVGLPVPPVIVDAFIRLTGPRAANQHLIQGSLMSPAEAYRIGLVDELLPLTQVVPRAIAWGHQIAALPPLALKTTREAVRADLVALARGKEKLTYEAMTEVWFSTEAQTALKAMVERVKSKK